MATNIKSRRKLSDLYKRGVEVRFGETDGKPYGKVGPFKDSDDQPIPLGESEIAVWVQPPSPIQREMAMREAQASRARALVRAKRDEESPEHLTALAFLVEMSDETLIDYVMISDTETRRNDATREILANDEWKDLTALQDAFRQYDEMSEEERDADPEYAAMMELDQKFGDQIDERAKELWEAQYDALKILGREKVEKKALEKRAELGASQSFMAEYERQMMFYAVRDIDDHGVLFFESARECADQEDEIRDVLAEALEQFISDVGEAKNSQGADSGSESSEPPSEPVTSEVSTPQAVSA